MPLRPHERQALGFLLRHLLYGVAAGICFGIMVLYFDIGHLRTLSQQSTDGWLTLVLLFGGLIVTFGSTAMAVGVMTQGQDEN